MRERITLKRLLLVFPVIMLVLTVLFFIDIKFMIYGLNILVFDAITAGIWIFVRLCIWANHKNTIGSLIAVAVITVAGLFAACILLFALAFNGAIYQYAEGTEPQTHRTFAVEYRTNILGKGTAKVYERFGPLLFPCDVPEYSGELFFDELDAKFAKVYISNDTQEIVVSLFIYGPQFCVPLE